MTRRGSRHGSTYRPGSDKRKSFAFIDDLSREELIAYLEDNATGSNGEDLFAYIRRNHEDFGLARVDDLSESEYWILYREAYDNTH